MREGKGRLFYRFYPFPLCPSLHVSRSWVIDTERCLLRNGRQYAGKQSQGISGNDGWWILLNEMKGLLEPLGSLGVPRPDQGSEPQLRLGIGDAERVEINTHTPGYLRQDNRKWGKAIDVTIQNSKFGVC